MRITYELSPIMVDVSPGDAHTLMHLCVRLCACVGGLAATAVMLMSWAHMLYTMLTTRR
jgi:hypothetical protein